MAACKAMCAVTSARQSMCKCMQAHVPGKVGYLVRMRTATECLQARGLARAEGSPSGDQARRRKNEFRPSSWNRCSGGAALPRSALPPRAPGPTPAGLGSGAAAAAGAAAAPVAGAGARRFFSTFWHTKSRAVAMHGVAPGCARLPAAGGFRPYTLRLQQRIRFTVDGKYYK